MNKIIYLSIVLLFLSCLINNEEVLARYTAEELDLLDPRLQPAKYCDSDRCIPTVRPLYANELNIRKTSKAVYEAMRGAGTREKPVVRILTSIGSIQRLEIAKEFVLRTKHFTGHSQTLEQVLKGDLSGAFESSILAVVTPLPILYVRELQIALTPPGIDEQTLVEILCTVSNFGIKTIVEFYEDQFHKSLIEDVKRNTPGTFQKVLVSLLRGRRIESLFVNHADVVIDAKILKGCFSKPWKVRPAFSEILGTRSFPHLRAVFVEYQKITGHEIEDHIKMEFSELEERGLLAIVKCIRSKVRFFADRLQGAMRRNKGPAMDRSLIRILVSRSEIDLADIKVGYEKIYKISLEHAVARKTGGFYRRVLTNMVRGNYHPQP